MNRLTVLLMGCLLLASCFSGKHEPTEAELSAFGTYVNSLDSTLEGKWFTRMGVSEDADSVLAYLRRELPRNGLDSTAFFIPQIAEDLDVVHRLAFDSLGQSINEVLTRLDHNLTKAYVEYTTGQRYGFMRPDKVLNRLQMKPDGSGYVQLFDHEVKKPDYTESERQMDSDRRMGYLLESQPSGDIYRALQKRLEQTTDTTERKKLAINMERCRWQLSQPEGGTTRRQVLVNIPAQQLWAVGGDSVLNMRICCGAYTTRTPLLNSTISYLQVNPDWIIPQKIVETDITRHAGDSAYFARNHYYIIERSSGDTLRPKNVTASQLRTGRLRVGQKGGAGNSLGRIVFRFPNNFAVYLHDTNNRGAFQRERRTLSHGCVRVQKPFDLACFLLPEADEWTLDRIRISMDIRPETQRGIDWLKGHADDPRPFRLMSYSDVAPKVPVHILYFTAFPNPETGVVDFWPDLYDYDRAISREIQAFLLK